MSNTTNTTSTGLVLVEELTAKEHNDYISRAKLLPDEAKLLASLQRYVDEEARLQSAMGGFGYTYMLARFREGLRDGVFSDTLEEAAKHYQLTTEQVAKVIRRL